MKTRLTELLGIEHPVMLAGMGGVSYSALAAAVSNAGGYGCLGASTMSSAQLAQEIAATRALTAKPFGVDLLTATLSSSSRVGPAPSSRDSVFPPTWWTSVTITTSS
jgi:NAD(P)H-dependent flavin oxidoreductase YrpB (nitropropane dioxygenase family)